MNIQEAVKKVEHMGEYERFVDEPISKKSVLNILSQIDETQKVAIPQFVAEWIEHCKGRRGTLYSALAPIKMSKELNEWMALGENDDVFARAWLDGYEIEQVCYVVTDGKRCYFERWDEVRAIIILDDMVGYENYVKKFASKSEAEEVAEQLGWIAKEVE